MSSGATEEKIEELEFRWIQKRGLGGKNKTVQFYESFVYDGEEYHLYDSVYMNNQGDPPYIGKLVKIWETPDALKRVKVQWFFRPFEISNYLGDTVALENELFLATGDGTGLVNVNPLEAVAGKCNVICISKDRRNPQPTAEELQMANYVFYRTFDVKDMTISDQMEDTVGGIQVKFVFNRKESDRSQETTDADGETLMRSGENSLDQSTNLKPDQNSNHMVEPKKVTNGKRVQTKREKFPGETKGVSLSKKEASREESSSHIHANISDKEFMESDEKLKTSGSKTVGCKTLDKVKEVKAPVIQVHLEEEGTKSARKSSDVNDKPSKRIKINDTIASAKDQNGVQKLIVSSNDAISPVNTDISSNAQSKVELVNNFVGSGKEDIKLAGNSAEWSTEMMNVLSRADTNLTNNKSSVGHEKSFVGSSKDSILTKDLHPLVERPLKIEKLNDSPKTIEDNKNRSMPKSITSNEIGKSPSEIRQPPSEMKKSCTRVTSKEGKNKSLPKNSVDKDKVGRANGQIFEVTRRPVVEKSKWFKELPWEQRMKTSHDEGTLVLLQNLDPEFSSGEVEDIIWHAFGENCTAKMVQHIATSNLHYGQAFAIFKTREAAERIVKKLDDGCLMLPNNRPLVGGVAVPPSLSEKQLTFVGHFSIDKVRRQTQRDMKDAVSTSHYSQTNTIEYEMAMSWCLLQSKSDRWWAKLFEQQNFKLQKLKSDLESK